VFHIPGFQRVGAKGPVVAKVVSAKGRAANMRRTGAGTISTAPKVRCATMQQR